MGCVKTENDKSRLLQDPKKVFKCARVYFYSVIIVTINLMKIIYFDKHLELRTSQKKENNEDMMIDNIIVNGFAWKQGQSA